MTRKTADLYDARNNHIGTVRIDAIKPNPEGRELGNAVNMGNGRYEQDSLLPDELTEVVLVYSILKSDLTKNGEEVPEEDFPWERRISHVELVDR